MYRKISLPCPHCGHTITVFHPLCPACGGSYFRDYAETVRLMRNPDPMGVSSRMALTWVYLMVIVAGTTAGMAAWAGAMG